MSDGAWAIVAFVLSLASLLWGIYIGKGVGYVQRMVEESLAEFPEKKP